jgi:DNA invertase Pin-like site-specific DNA recombinase
MLSLVPAHPFWWSMPSLVLGTRSRQIAKALPTLQQGRLRQATGVAGAMAELESSLISERVTAGRRAAAARGKHFGRPPLAPD